MARAVRSVALLLALAGGGAWANDAAVRVLENARFVLSNSAAPPGEALDWQPRRIPDNWDKSQAGAGGIGWYRFEIALGPVGETWALALTHRATAYVNGIAVGGAEELHNPQRSSWHRPRLYEVPAALLRPGKNEIHIGLVSLPHRRGGLYHAELGPLRLVQERFDRWHLLKVTALRALCVIAAAFTFVFGLMWLRRRHDSVYG